VQARKKELEPLFQKFLRFAGRPNLKSLLIVEHFGLNDKPEEPKIHALVGEQWITERLFDLSFQISPFSFFQTNTLATEKLYSAIGAAADVTFVKFPDVVADFQRLYECKLSEFDASWSTTVVAQGYDRYDSSAQKGKPITQFTETPRIVEFQNSLHEEVELTRLALQRSLLTLRSLELGAPINVELNCLEREMLDMRNELSLLADASACFPRIWDAATSLHEPSNRDPAPDAGSSSSISTPEPQSPYPYPSSDSYAP
jgi:hypothetical protein